ncbi:MAG: glycerol kinase GlpK, partial [Armatimonadetes bacterium]|nr:glycerol kinase GlpK [Armatimonadota bacterium]
PDAIWSTQLAAAHEALRKASATARDLAAMGITNQRETTLIWDRRTARPIARAVVWQDRRTADACAALRSEGIEPLVQERTGLLLDPYFSATKVAAILDGVSDARARAERGELAFGTVDTYLLWRMTGGSEHATDVSNASRTLLMNADTCEWDSEMAAIFGVPQCMLPRIRPTAHAFGETDPSIFGAAVPICALVGDQQAAAFGQACIRPGMAKNTYGTGSFVLLNTGAERSRSRAGLLSTVAWRLGEAPPVYALEGSVFVTGAAIQWLRDGLGIIASAAQTEALAASVGDACGVTFVPAFVGLGAPHWQPDVRGAIMGLTRGTTKAHVVRAALEAACFQTCDVLDALAADAGRPIASIRADGGMAANNLVMQMQADLAGICVERPAETETTALGAALLAGIGSGVLPGEGAAAELWRPDRVFEPRIGTDEREARRRVWRDAVRRLCDARQ